MIPVRPVLFFHLVAVNHMEIVNDEERPVRAVLSQLQAVVVVLPPRSAKVLVKPQRVVANGDTGRGKSMLNRRCDAAVRCLYAAHHHAQQAAGPQHAQSAQVQLLVAA